MENQTVRRTKFVKVSEQCANQLDCTWMSGSVKNESQLFFLQTERTGILAEELQAISNDSVAFSKQFANDLLNCQEEAIGRECTQITASR